MKIPYGRSNFADIRREGFFYVDKTPFLPVLERGESGYAYLLFLRPRRIGKSLLLSMMEHYYDIGRANEFDELFGLHHRLQVLKGRKPLKAAQDVELEIGRASCRERVCYVV